MRTPSAALVPLSNRTHRRAGVPHCTDRMYLHLLLHQYVKFGTVACLRSRSSITAPLPEEATEAGRANLDGSDEVAADLRS